MTTPDNRATRRAKAAEAKKAREAEAPPAERVVQRRTYVVFAYDDEEGFQRQDRMWIDDIADLRTLGTILSTEQVIAEQKNVKNVRIVFWRGLEG